MNTSVIRHRVADFLKQFQPFDTLSEADLLEVAGSGRVKFHEAGEFVYRRGEAKGKFIWMIQQGTVQLLRGDPDQGDLHDVLGDGDLIGLDSGFYLHSALTASDVILYAIDSAVFEALTSRYPAVQQYLAAHFGVSASPSDGAQSWLDAPAPPEEYLRARFGRSPRLPGAAVAPLGIGTREAIREMLRGRTDVLTLTEEGRAENPPAAVLRDSDLALFCGQNPIQLRREILESESPEELGILLELSNRMVLGGLARPADVDDCARMGSAMVAATAETCIRLSLGSHGGARGWLAFGRLARGEMLRPSSPMIAAVYNDQHPNEERAATAGRCAAWLEACGLGSGTHPGMSISEWQQFYTETAADPLAHDLFARREFFDVSLLSGDATLLTQLSDGLAEALRQDNLLVPLLANDTLAHLPPLTFYRGLVLDLDGGERESLDLASTALEPISDAARVFALDRLSLSIASTLERLECAATMLPQHGRILREAADAFRIALYHQSVAGMPIIRPASLSKYDQRLLKTAFSSILNLLELTKSTFIAAE
jgi:signal-transduction protein with cAMP-binding, CBS, and nucleotidyltransferase domain